MTASMSLLGRSIFGPIQRRIVDNGVLSEPDNTTPWILAAGAWNDDGQWIDSENWNDGE